jgi:hypothetical protein
VVDYDRSIQTKHILLQRVILSIASEPTYLQYNYIYTDQIETKTEPKFHQTVTLRFDTLFDTVNIHTYIHAFIPKRQST